MLNLIAFILTIAGCLNWLLIGLLQYDFVAGIFGYQASIFSRIIYIIIGIAAAFVVFRLIANKGSFKIYQKREKKKEKAIEKHELHPANVEASKEIVKEEKTKNHENHEQEFKPIQNNHKEQNGIFDEHFNN